MDPRRLLIFRTVVRNGSIGAGARELGWTQPAVSQHLTALEKEVGTQLLLRSSSGITPTEAGRRLHVHAEAIAAQLRTADEEIADLLALRRGSVRFAAFPSAAATIFPPAIAHVSSHAPGVEITFDELEPPDAIARLLGGELDLAVIFRYSCTDIECEGTLEWTELMDDPVLLAMPADHPLADKDGLRLSDLASEQWIAGCERCRAHLLETARDAGFTPRIRHSTDDYHVVQRLITHGAGIALLPAIALDAYRCDRVAFRALPELSNRTLGLVHRPGAERIPAVAALKTALGEAARNHSRQAS
ncbi:LysR substrate-binding domain-containing protein [Devriesea agamarum]|uniref:LysR substrate-binding domain-containing protein n=1 Tax=Devriesea agamarum TaxID=472569 RepID=UPI00071E524B|nr:LysR substrate-binding domain-containing protein [Devriesea agamarum]